MPRDLTLTDVEILRDFRIHYAEHKSLVGEPTADWYATLTYGIITDAESLPRQRAIKLNPAQVAVMENFLEEMEQATKTEEKI